VSDDEPGVVIVGAGFSGAMLAARLAERGLACSLIDRTGTFGPGLAYSTPFEGAKVSADRCIHPLRVRPILNGSRSDSSVGQKMASLAQHNHHRVPDSFGGGIISVARVNEAASPRINPRYVQERSTGPLRDSVNSLQ
jgi:hypothetical protein